MPIARRLGRVLRQAGLPLVSVSIGAQADKQTWTVLPEQLQAQAQPLIDAFDPNDPAHLAADLDEAIKATMDQERLISAVVWTVIDTYSSPATITKYNAARTKIVSAYKAQPWKP